MNGSSPSLRMIWRFGFTILKKNLLGVGEVTIAIVLSHALALLLLEARTEAVGDSGVAVISVSMNEFLESIDFL